MGANRWTKNATVSPVRRHPFGALALLGLLLGGCGDEYGAVTLSWQFVDRNGDRIYPGGLFDRGGFRRNACDMPGIGAEGPTRYDLGVQLEICDPGCMLGCEHPDCQIQPPVVFSCRTYRGADTEVPASDAPYRFTLRPVLDVELSGTRCVHPTPACFAVPGPRERTVEPGRMVDLQVYQIAIDVDPGSGEALDLEACGCA